MSRALTRFAPVDAGAKARAGLAAHPTLPLLGLAPLLLAGFLLAAPWLGRTASGGYGRPRAGVVRVADVRLGAHLAAADLDLPGGRAGPAQLARRLPRGARDRRVRLGFLQGFLVFCSLPIDLARPFGGLLGVGVACALLLWLWVLHAVVLVGYSLTWAMHGLLRSGRPAASRGPTADTPNAGTAEGSAIAGRR